MSACKRAHTAAQGRACQALRYHLQEHNPYPWALIAKVLEYRDAEHAKAAALGHLERERPPAMDGAD